MSPLARVFATAALCALTTACGDDAPYIAPEYVADCRTFAHDTVRWLVASDSAGRHFLDAYCAGVGPAHFEAASSIAGDTPDTLVIVNWNMALGEGQLGALVADVRNGAVTGQPVRHFVLLLQEAPRTDPAVPAADALPEGAKMSELDMFGSTDIIAFARTQRMHVLYVPSMRNGTDAPEDQGNAILSTLPLYDPEVYELPAGIRRRVVVSAAVHWPSGQRVRLVSAHLDNFSPQKLIGSLGSVRARQARALAAMLPAGQPLLLGGDLNTWTRGTNEDAFQALRRVLPRPDTIDARPTATRLARGIKLDYMLFRGPDEWHFEEQRVDDRYNSDHNPIVGMLFLAR
jgi:endonuclease/exonuclease/phosphatase family metal-dependent hydrolase